MAQQIQFGVYKVDLRSGEVTKFGTRIRLQDRPFQILVTLLRNQGEVVTREELRQQLWADGTFVDFDHSISSAINKLRNALGDTAANPKFIETVGRRGYRFIYPITAIETETESPASPPVDAPAVPAAIAPRLPTNRHVVAAGIVVSLIIVISAFFLFSPAKERNSISSIAVLPLKNLSNSTDEEFFSEGLTDELNAKLATLQGIRVISRTSAIQYKDTHKTLPAIARELHVDAIVDGSVLRFANRVRITVQLVDASSDRQIWAASYEREQKDILELQNEVTRQIAESIKLNVDPAERERLNSSKPIDPEAHEYYLRGRFYWNKRTSADLRTSTTYFQKAITIAPDYARAYAGLSDSYAMLAAYSLDPPQENVEKARIAAKQALQLDPELAEAHTSLALIYQNYDWDWPNAEAEYRRALALDQNYATAHHWYAEFLSYMGRFNESEAEYTRARQLDPLSLIIRTDYAVSLYYARKYDDSIHEFQAVQAIDPDFPRAHLVEIAYAQQGRFQEAIEHVEKFKGMDAVWKQGLLTSLYARAGRNADARREYKAVEDVYRKQHLNPGPMITACLGMGHNREALDWLDKAYEGHYTVVSNLKVDPLFDPLRRDPRFQGLLRKLKLAQ